MNFFKILTNRKKEPKKNKLGGGNEGKGTAEKMSKNEEQQPKNCVSELKIDKKNLIKFQKFRKMVKRKGFFLQKRSLSMIFSQNYNKCPLNSMNVFEELYKDEQPQNASANLYGLSIPGQGANFEVPIPVFKRTRKKRNSKFYGKNFGIFFNKPEYVRFENLPRRLKHELKLENMWLRFMSSSKRQGESGEPESHLRKRPAHVFDSVNPQATDPALVRPREHLSESRSLFMSSKDKSKNLSLLKSRILIRSRDEDVLSQDNKFPKPFLSVNADSLKCKKRTTPANGGLSDDVDEMDKMLRSIQILNSKSISDAIFRETIVKIALNLQKKNKKRRIGI